MSVFAAGRGRQATAVFLLTGLAAVSHACAQESPGGTSPPAVSGSTSSFGGTTSATGAGSTGGGLGPGATGGGTLGDLDAMTAPNQATACFGNGWNCKIDPCEGGPKTTVTAKVYDPAGKVPLYDVAVYVPNADLASIATGRTCDNCATPVSGSPIASALTDATGQFVMQNAPVGKNVPLVIQVGKWRRTITLPEVKACQDNKFDDPTTFRLPRSQSEGNLPKIALGIGDADTLECLLRRIGVADSEFTNPNGSGRVNLFMNDIGTTGGTTSYATGGTFPPLSGLLASAAASADGGTADPFSAYDIVMLSCQGSQSAGQSVTTLQKQGMKAFADNGGRVFLSHYSYSWLRSDMKYTPSPFPPITTWGGSGGDGTYLIDTSFPRGNDMADWLLNVSASTTKGQIKLVNVKDPALVVTAGVAQRWVYEPTRGTPYISANTPIEKASTPDQQCGRVVHTGIHVASALTDSHSPFPGGCVAADLTAQEKALEFLFFDMSSCVTDESKPPPPPPVIR